MGQALYQTRRRQRTGVRPTFGFLPVLAVLFAFLAIHAHLAVRLPASIAEAPLTGPQQALPWDIARALAEGGQWLVPGILGARMPFVALSLLTSLVAYAAVRQLTAVAIAPAVAVIWLNTTVVFGIGSALATREAVAAFGLVAILYGLARLRHGPTLPAQLLIAAGGAIALSAGPATAWALVPLPLVAVVDLRARQWLRRPGFIALLAMAAFVIWSAGPVDPAIVPPYEAGMALVLAGALLGPGVFFFATTGVSALAGFDRSLPRRLALPAIMVAAPLAAFLFGAIRLSDLAMIAPVATCLAAIAAAEARGFLRNWISEVTTPFAFLSLILAIYLAAFPTNVFLPRLPWLNGLFGWQAVALSVERHASEAGATFVLAPDDETARRLSDVLQMPVFVAGTGAGGALSDCGAAGIFLSPSPGGEALFGNFRQFTRIGQVNRIAGAWAIDQFTLFSVAEPTAAMGCPRG